MFVVLDRLCNTNVDSGYDFRLAFHNEHNSDTSKSAMVLNPDIQAKAREEVDAVVGNRLPEFSDMPSLPYVQAMLDETLRWAPVTPLGMFKHSLYSFTESCDGQYSSPSAHEHRG